MKAAVVDPDGDITVARHDITPENAIDKAIAAEKGNE